MLTYRRPALNASYCSSVSFEPAGTDHEPSAPFSKVMIGGPFWPGAEPSWICPMVPSIPEVVTLPLTDLSSPILILPSPLASVVTAGTSWSPVRVTLTSLAFATVKLAASSVAKAARWRIELILLAPLVPVYRLDFKATRKNVPAVHLVPAQAPISPSARCWSGPYRAGRDPDRR